MKIKICLIALLALCAHANERRAKVVIGENGWEYTEYVYPDEEGYDELEPSSYEFSECILNWDRTCRNDCVTGYGFGPGWDSCKQGCARELREGKAGRECLKQISKN